MTRIAQNQIAQSLLVEIARNREQVSRFSKEVATGLKVIDPGDSKFSGTINQYREVVNRIAGHKQRLEAAKGSLSFQDNALTQTSDLLVRARELATQAANETVGMEVRSQMSGEVFDLRDQLIALANSQYQGAYVWGGVDSGDAPYGQTTYTNPATGPASQRWIYDNTTTEPGNALSRSVNITDNMSVVVAKPGSGIFNNAIYALERLGRALAGYDTQPASGQPDGTGNAFTLPAQTAQQTQAIQGCIDLLNTSRETDILPERVSLGAALKRLDTAGALLDLTETDAREALSKLQDADIAEAGTNLSQAQTALQVSFSVTSRVLQLNILDYL